MAGPLPCNGPVVSPNENFGLRAQKAAENCAQIFVVSVAKSSAW
jgi:hypothetical protein